MNAHFQNQETVSKIIYIWSLEYNMLRSYSEVKANTQISVWNKLIYGLQHLISFWVRLCKLEAKARTNWITAITEVIGWRNCFCIIISELEAKLENNNDERRLLLDRYGHNFHAVKVLALIRNFLTLPYLMFLIWYIN